MHFNAANDGDRRDNWIERARRIQVLNMRFRKHRHRIPKVRWALVGRAIRVDVPLYILHGCLTRSIEGVGGGG